jgi:NAD(P)-dependent dehydrogenase (short-subunit alcohol dehydrogenase family)
MPISVVTGATGGLGKWIALGLARAGHTVVMIGRNRQRGDDAAAWIAARAPSARLELLISDLSSLAATRMAGMLIDARYPAIDVLVNNAGTFCTQREVTGEGHERVIALNHLSPFILTRALIPALRNGAQAGGCARIVNIGSSTADRARINPADLESKRHWGMVKAYSQSKLALTMATFGWARRLDGKGVTANVVHPGAVATELVRANGPIGLVWRAMAPFLLTEEQGADTPLHVALSPEFATTTGAYVKRRQVARPNRRALDPVLVERVWDATETLAGG